VTYTKPEPALPKKASTKNGTTQSAKRPSKARDITKQYTEAQPQPTKGKTMKTTKATAKSKTSKTSKATKAAKSTKPAKAAPKKEGRGRPPSVDTSKKIKVLTDGNENPRREGSGGFTNWKLIVKSIGKTVADYLKAGGTLNHLNWDVAHGNVKLV
jgi:hypothetical protein